MVKNIDSTISHDIEDLFRLTGTKEDALEKISSAPYSYWRSTFKEVRRNPLAVLSIIAIILIVLLAIIGPIIKSYNITQIPYDYPLDESITYAGPNANAWLGIGGEKMGWFKKMDLWTVLWQGTRFSLILATTISVIDIILGIVIGSFWGYFKWLDPIMLEIRNFINNVPSLLLYILLMQFLTKSFWTLVFVLCMFGWLGLASFIRNQIIIIRNRDYNIASQTLGSSPVSMIQHNLLPYLVSVIVTVVSTAIPDAISAEVGLAFFGLSYQPNQQVTLGQLLTSATNDDWMVHPYLLIVPMLVLAPLTIAFFYLGLTLADATDPKTHR